MPMLSYIHQLFSAEQCQAYIHTLRWKDRPLQCPRCQSHAVSLWGTYHYRPGCKRYWCHSCRRTFNDLTHTLLAQSKRSLAHWILATFLLCLSCSSHRIARELGVHVRTSYRWCWRLRNTAVSYEIDRQLEGTVEADDLYHTAGSCTSSLRLSLPPVNRVKSPHFSTCMRGFYHDTRSLFLSVGAGRPGVVVRHTPLGVAQRPRRVPDDTRAPTPTAKAQA